MEGCPVTKLGKMFLNYLATLCMKINMFQYVMSECALKKGKTSLFKSHKGLLVTYFTNNLMKLFCFSHMFKVFQTLFLTWCQVFDPHLRIPTCSFYRCMGLDLWGKLISLIPLFWLGSVFAEMLRSGNFPSKMNSWKWPWKTSTSMG